jgi:hypothetical protein
LVAFVAATIEFCEAAWILEVEGFFSHAIRDSCVPGRIYDERKRIGEADERRSKRTGMLAGWEPSPVIALWIKLFMRPLGNIDSIPD